MFVLTFNHSEIESLMKNMMTVTLIDIRWRMRESEKGLSKIWWGVQSRKGGWGT